MKKVVGLVSACVIGTGCPATGTDTGSFLLDRSVQLESGDIWSERGDRFRLYGVQSCLRGTHFHNSIGTEQDCGDASMAFLAALIKDTKPSCIAVARSATVIYALCAATVGGQKLDLATVLIAEGFAFASLDANGLPLNPAYAVAEQQARLRKSGLWQFPDLPHPSIFLRGRARQTEGSSP